MTYSITVNNVSKQYKTGKKLTNFRELFLPNSGKSTSSYHWALRDLSFKLKEGEALGIIGPNGAGKTTTLKLLTQVTRPTSGNIHLNGRFSALIELGAGFHSDLTGRENIFLNGTILGMRRSEIKDRFEDIVDFAGIGDYLDTPVKRYSSGMYARLGFAIAAHVDPKILLVDEVLAVGDMAFREKCYIRMAQMIDQGTTLVFVSHDFSAIQRVCNRCLVINGGDVAFDGPPGEAVASYSNIIRKSAVNNFAGGRKEEGLSLSVMTGEALIENVHLLGWDNKPRLSFKSGEMVKVQVQVKFAIDIRSPQFACTIRQPDGSLVNDFFTFWAKKTTPNFTAGSTAIIQFGMKLNLLSGTYHLGVNIASFDLAHYYDRMDRALDFVVESLDGSQGIVDMETSFDITRVE
jgi:ABC-type polysaccharide/polyol phosphate transport system ATPase subunit